MSDNAYVYLIHMDVAVAGKQRHYIGFTSDLGRRLYEHFNGRGARLTAKAVDCGIVISLVRLWRGDRQLEANLKRRGGYYYCPICSKVPDVRNGYFNREH